MPNLSEQATQIKTWDATNGNSFENLTASTNPFQLTGSMPTQVYKLYSNVALNDNATRITDAKLYELKDHLGNVRVVVSDLKLLNDNNANDIIDAGDYFYPSVKSFSDYYPFGMEIKSRSWFDADGAYRYGFIGEENDNEVNNVTGGSQDHIFRSYDNRLGRYKSRDPLANDYPWNSPYAYSENRVIDGKDLEGRELNLVIQTYDNNGYVQSIDVITYRDAEGQPVNQNLVDPVTGQSYSNVNTLIMNINPPNGTPAIQKFGSLNNAAGNFRTLVTPGRRQFDTGGNDASLIARNLNVGRGMLVGAGSDGQIDGPLSTQNFGGSLGTSDRTVPSRRFGFRLNRLDALTANFPNYSAVLPNDANTQSQVADVADYLTVYPNINVTLSGNSAIPNNASDLRAGGFTNENGNFVAGGNVGGLKQARANAFGNAISNFGNNTNASFGAGRVNSVASPSGSSGGQSVTLNYNF